MPRITILELPDAGVAVAHDAFVRHQKHLARRGRVGLTDRIALRDVMADLERAAPESLRGELQLEIETPRASPAEALRAGGGPLITKNQVDALIGKDPDDDPPES